MKNWWAKGGTTYYSWYQEREWHRFTVVNRLQASYFSKLGYQCVFLEPPSMYVVGGFKMGKKMCTISVEVCPQTIPQVAGRPFSLKALDRGRVNMRGSHLGSWLLTECLYLQCASSGYAHSNEQKICRRFEIRLSPFLEKRKKQEASFPKGRRAPACWISGGRTATTTHTLSRLVVPLQRSRQVMDWELIPKAACCSLRKYQRDRSVS